ncbi:MAG: YfhO family protein, partial [Muribaculaceae bacterium]|nr:YfhO family protein [Muribaculaceae bacterium]
MKKIILLVITIVSIALIPVLLSGGMNWPVTDFIKQQVPFILETKRMFASGHPWWSWNTFAGDNFIGAYSFYTVTSPFVWFACLFSVDKIFWGIVIALYLKAICTVLFAYLYFKKNGFSVNISVLV